MLAEAMRLLVIVGESSAVKSGWPETTCCGTETGFGATYPGNAPICALAINRGEIWLTEVACAMRLDTLASVIPTTGAVEVLLLGATSTFAERGFKEACGNTGSAGAAAFTGTAATIFKGIDNASFT